MLMSMSSAIVSTTVFVISSRGRWGFIRRLRMGFPWLQERPAVGVIRLLSLIPCRFLHEGHTNVFGSGPSGVSIRGVGLWGWRGGGSGRTRTIVMIESLLSRFMFDGLSHEIIYSVDFG